MEASWNSMESMEAHGILVEFHGSYCSDVRWAQFFSVLKANMAGCVDSTLFHTKLEELKQSKKIKSSNTSIFMENEFFDENKRWLQATPEEKKQLNLDKAENCKKSLESDYRRKGYHLR